jgi:hypothetical protein
VSTDDALLWAVYEAHVTGYGACLAKQHTSNLCVSRMAETYRRWQRHRPTRLQMAAIDALRVRLSDRL